MARYILRRFALMLVALWVIVTLTFVFEHLIPGDPFDNPKLTQHIHQLMLEKYGLDQPITVQYGRFIGQLVHGNLGNSLHFMGQSVNKMIATEFPVSAELGLEALVWSIAVGMFLGLMAALRRTGATDWFAMAIAVITISIPSFIIAALFQYFIGVKLGWLPVAQWKGFAWSIMPAFALGASTVGVMARFMRTSTLDTISQDYIRTAWSKGLSHFQVVWRHMLRNSILPLVTIAGPLIAAIVTGSFVIEVIFGIPGLGRAFVNSIFNRDYGLIMGTTIFYAALVIVLNFLVDIAYGFIDPRIRITGEREV